MKYYLFLLLLLSIVVLFYICYESYRRKKENLARGEIVGLWGRRERRRFKRLKTVLPIQYEISNNSRPTQEAVTRDISQGGVGVIIYEKLKEGTPLRIWIDLANKKEKLLVLGDIAWLKEILRQDSDKRAFYAGIRFTTIDTPTQLQLFDFIYTLEKEEKEKR